MCNDYGNAIGYAEYAEALRQLQLRIVSPTQPPNYEPRQDIWPTESAPVIRRAEDGVEIVQLRWGFPPANPKGRAVINFRSEGRSFANSKRCLVPASHFYEFRGARSPKEKFEFKLSGEEWFCFAGLWRDHSAGNDGSFTLLTTEPGPDVAPIHNRQMVVLRREQWKPWLDLTAPESALLKPLPAGALTVTKIR